MPAPFDYTVQRPDIMGAIGAYEAGRDRNRQVMQQGKQDMFAQYLPGALKNDPGAVQGAMSNGTPEQQMQLQQALARMEDAQLQKTREQQEKFSRLAQWADTPEKWAQATQMAEAEGMKGASQVPFEQRGAKLAGMLSVKDQLDQEWKRREFQLQERNVNSQIGERNRSGQTYAGWAAPSSEGDVMNPYEGINDPKQRDMLYRQLTTDFNSRQKDYQKDRVEAQNILASTEEFLALNKKVGSGGFTGSGGLSSVPLVNSARNMVDADWSRMNAITDRLTPLMRQGLPGAASDRDMQTFRGATVGTGKLGEANVGIARGLQVAAKNVIDKGLFDEAYFRRNRHLQGSDNAWNRYLEENPIFNHNSDPSNPELNRSRKSWREYVSPSAQAPQAAAPPTGGDGWKIEEVQ